MKKFFAIIGNPPYQEDTKGTSDNPIYHLFMDESYKIGDNVELITPARFLFNAGKTPKTWNRKMLSDPHLKVVFYNPNPKFFSNVELKGGVAVTLHSNEHNFGAINLFVKDESMRGIVDKVRSVADVYLTQIGNSQNSFKFTEKLYRDHPELEGSLSDGHRLDLKSNVLEKLKSVFLETVPEEDRDQYDRVFGLVAGRRGYRYLKRGYLCNNSMSDNLLGYKVAASKATGSGAFGETLSDLVVIPPHTGMTETFISFGNFATEVEADNLISYIKTKFVRSLLGVLKITQDNTVAKYALIPLQDFTPNSDIDWSKPVADIDRQLYRKYGLTDDEVAFIDSHVKEMS